MSCTRKIPPSTFDSISDGHSLIYKNNPVPLLCEVCNLKKLQTLLRKLSPLNIHRKCQSVGFKMFFKKTPKIHNLCTKKNRKIPMIMFDHTT